ASAHWAAWVGRPSSAALVVVASALRAQMQRPTQVRAAVAGLLVQARSPARVVHREARASLTSIRLPPVSPTPSAQAAAAGLPGQVARPLPAATVHQASLSFGSSTNGQSR